jgi:cytidylate kinase
MNISLERSGGYFTAELRGSRASWIKPPTPFVTISRECSSGGSALAQILAQKLNAESHSDQEWGIFGGNVVKQMLATYHLPEQLARFLPEDRVPEFRATIGEIVGRHPNLWELVQLTKRTIRRLAINGYVILIGRGTNFLTADLPGGIHVRLVAPPEHRARYHARRFNVPERDAFVHNARCDAARRRYVQTHFNADVAAPAAYDLVINTAQVSLAEAADIVAAHLRAHAPVAA